VTLLLSTWKFGPSVDNLRSRTVPFMMNPASDLSSCLYCLRRGPVRGKKAIRNACAGATLGRVVCFSGLVDILGSGPFVTRSICVDRGCGDCGCDVLLSSVNGEPGDSASPSKHISVTWTSISLLLSGGSEVSIRINFPLPLRRCRHHCTMNGQQTERGHLAGPTNLVIAINFYHSFLSDNHRRCLSLRSREHRAVRRHSWWCICGGPGFLLSNIKILSSLPQKGRGSSPEQERVTEFRCACSAYRRVLLCLRQG